MNRWQGAYDACATTRYPALLAYAALLAGDRQSGEDLLHDALVRVFGRPRRFASSDHAEAYVRTVLAHLAMDRARGRNRLRAALARAAQVPVVADHAERIGASDAVGTALAALPPQVRTCVVLRYFDDLSTAAIAQRLGIAEGTVKRYLADGRAALASLIDVEEPAATMQVTAHGRSWR